VALSLGLTVTVCLLNLPVPLLIQGLVDRVVTRGEPASLPWFAAGLVAVFAAQAGVGLVNTVVIGRVGLAVVRDLRHRLYAHLQRVGLSFYDRTPSGVIISRLMDDVTVVQALITGQTVAAVTDLGTTVAVTAMLLVRDARLACVALGFVPVYLVNVRWHARRIRHSSRQVRERLDTVFSHLKQKLDGALVVKAHACEAAEVAGFASHMRALYEPRVRLDRLGTRFTSLSATISGVAVVAVFGAAAVEILDGRMTPGGVISTVTLAGLLFGPVTRLADLTNVFEQAATSVDRLGEILDTEPEVREPARPVRVRRSAGRVEFDRVGFGYRPGHRVVRDICLAIEPGTRVAIVGPTGSGKSTLVNLLMRFYDPGCGEIRLDGVPISRISTADLRRQFGVVLQDPVLFRGSLAENIRYGKPGASDREVENAARAALIHGFAQRLPGGYRTQIGEGGFKLSQGERQRVAIARALVRDPSIIVLDEATSSLDPMSEGLIQASLANLFRGRSALVIAHRLSTVVDADVIVVMEEGRVVQQGTHTELLREHHGLYRRLCVRQFGVQDPVHREPTVPAGLHDPRPFEEAARDYHRLSA
jgi:ABC-type multidrug transport system fused ATPase/permease subunit